MKINHFKNKLLYFVVICFSVVLLVSLLSFAWIGQGVKNRCQNAQEEYSGDCVEALISLLNDENREYRDRNSAIWALGQLGDPRALPVLESYYTGNISSRESFDKTISQYELRKAINLARGGVNITAFMWR